MTTVYSKVPESDPSDDEKAYYDDHPDNPKKNIKEGIYFNMPEEEYHALPYLSRSGIEDILVDVEEAWYKSSLNPDRPESKPTDAMALGTAIHSAILEPKSFNNLYCTAPKPEDFGDKVILKSCEDLGNFLSSVGEKKTGRKSDLIDRASKYIYPDSNEIIWDVINDNFLSDVATRGKRILTTTSSEIIEGIKDSLNRKPELKEIFSKGYPEVVIIWKDEETGVMCKCRLDYVRPGAIGEVKSFSLKGKKKLYKAVCDEIFWNKYYLQFAVYSHALETIIRKIRLGEAGVFGDADEEWLKMFLKTPRKRFFILFVRTAPPFQALSVELSKNINDGTDHLYHSEAYDMMMKSIKTYKEMREKHPDRRWVNKEYAFQLDDLHIPNIQYQ